MKRECRTCDLNDECLWGQEHPKDMCASWMDPSVRIGLIWTVLGAGIAWVVIVVELVAFVW